MFVSLSSEMEFGADLVFLAVKPLTFYIGEVSLCPLQTGTMERLLYGMSVNSNTRSGPRSGRSHN